MPSTVEALEYNGFKMKDDVEFVGILGTSHPGDTRHLEAYLQLAS